MCKRILSLFLTICLIASICAFMPISVSAETSGTCGDNLTWTLDDDGVLTISGEGNMWDYEYGSSPWYKHTDSIFKINICSGVTSIGKLAFYWCNKTTSIKIPHTVTEIGEHAFYYFQTEAVYIDDIESWCSISFVDSFSSPFRIPTDLYIDNVLATNIQVPNTITTISEYTFYNCKSITNVYIPSSVENITNVYNSFNCPNLTKFTVSENNMCFSSNDGVLYNKDYSDLICFPQGKSGTYNVLNSTKIICEYAFNKCRNITDVIIPKGVLTIGNSAFRESSVQNIILPNTVNVLGKGAFAFCVNLLSVVLSENITEIQPSTFSDCYKLKNIELNKGVKTIGNGAFNACAFTQIKIPKSVIEIQNDAFYNCSKLTDIYYAGSESDWTNISIGTDTHKYFTNSTIHYNCSATSGTCGDNLAWTLDDGVLTIWGFGDMQNYADFFCSPWFDKKEEITSVKMQNGITSIGWYAFSYCINLTSITLPDSVTSIGDSAFCVCSSLTSITLPDSVTSIGSSAFSACNSLTNIILHDSVTSIGSSAFHSCSSLTSITIPDGVTTIGVGAFEECSSLTSITLPDSVTSIDDSAFSHCSSLTSITLPNSVTSIGDGAFEECSSLTNITIPDGVMTIGNRVFSGCNSLTSITLPDSVTSIGGFAFGACSSLTSIALPDSVTSIDGSAFCYCSSLTSITIPSGVTSIGGYAFEGCISLTSITIPDSVTSIGCGTFWSCSSLTKITIPDGVTSIGDDAFRDCSSLTSITLPNSVISIGAKAFENCESLTDVYYSGSESEWNKINISHGGNTCLTNATIHYNYKSDESTTAEFCIDDKYCIENGKNSILGSVAISDNTQNIKDITDNVEWKSSDETVVEIGDVSYVNSFDEKSALISIDIIGHKIGKATITGTTRDGRTATATVSVEPTLNSLDYGTVYGPATIEYEISTESDNKEYFEEFLSSLTYDVSAVSSIGISVDSTGYKIASDGKKAVFTIKVTPTLNLTDNIIKIKSTYGQSADIKVNVKEEISDFTLGKDNQKFSHSAYNFFEDPAIRTKLYSVSEKYYKAWERMVEQGIITEKQYLDLVNDSNKEGVPFDYEKKLHDWGGVCFGLATTLLSSFDKLTTKLKYTSFDSDATCFFDIGSMPKNNTELRDTINFYQSLQNYIKASAGTYNDVIGLSQSLYGSDWTTDTKKFWDSLAEAASYIQTGPQTPLMLCYFEKDGGHVIIICGFEETQKEYIFTFYDVNSVSHNTPTGKKDTFSVNKNDYTFDLVDANGTKIYEEWRCLKYYNTLDIQSLIGSINYADENDSVLAKSITGKNNSVTFKFKADSNFTLSNGTNKTLKYDNGTFDSDITIYDFDFESNGSGSYITLEIENDDKYVYIGANTNDFTIYNDNMYYSCNSQGADTITISENNIKLAGDAITADVTIGLDKELINISGKANGNIEMTSENKTIKCESDNSISDIVVSTIKHNEKTEETIENSDNFEFSVKEDDNSNKPNNNRNTTGGGSSVSSYTVKFETNGGSKVSSQSVSKNSTVKEPTAPTKDGFEFAGWYSDKDLKTKYDFSDKVMKSITLYAAWTEKKAETTDPADKPSTPETKGKFTDVNDSDWFSENVKYVFENGLMSGVSENKFAPNDNLTRAMLVTILYRAAGEPEVNKSVPFADVAADSYYANAVIWAQQNGIVSGVSENEFAPDTNITREQIATIMFRYAKEKGYDVSVGESTNILSYTDAEDISEYAIDAMQYAVGSGLIKGKSETTLNPKDTATRAEIAAILQRFIEGNK